MAKATKSAAEKLDLEEIIEHQSEETGAHQIWWAPGRDQQLLNQVKDENIRKK